MKKIKAYALVHIDYEGYVGVMGVYSTQEEALKGKEEFSWLSDNFHIYSTNIYLDKNLLKEMAKKEL